MLSGVEVTISIITIGKDNLCRLSDYHFKLLDGGNDDSSRLSA
jgi:hypothetical protein